MRILNIDIFYGEGSTGRIVRDIHTRLERDGHESYVAYGIERKRGAVAQSDKVYKVTSNFLARQYYRIAKLTGLRYNCAYLETYLLTRHIRRVKPDLVHIHCMNSAYLNPFILLHWLGKHGFRVLVTHHADVTITANCDHAYDCELWKTGCTNHCSTMKEDGLQRFLSNSALSWKQMKNAFASVKKLYASGVSVWMADRVRQSPFFAGRECRVIENGIDTASFRYDADNRNVMLSQMKREGRKVVLHVTPSLTQKLKGGRYVFELARLMPEVTFVVVGHRDEHIGDLPGNIVLLPYISSPRELAGYYQTADATLLTSRRESFSQVTAESLCCGTPVVGFCAGATETIALREYSSFVTYGDVEQLKGQLEDFLFRSFDKAQISREACRRYDAEQMYAKYLAYYRDILGTED